jgi:threonine dehydrogenase-like Zn-dependent dehydrogenase
MVVGCGMIGLLAVWAIRVVAPQAHVTAMARHPHQAEMAHRLGADEVIADDDGYAEAARVTGGKLYTGPLNNQTLLGGFDVIYDVVGTGRSIQDSLRWARAGGTVVVVGITPKLFKTDLSPIWHQEIDLIGSVVHGVEEWHGRSVHGYELVIQWMQDRALPTEDLITHRYSWSDFKKAVGTAADKRTGAIKVVLRMDG